MKKISVLVAVFLPACFALGLHAQAPSPFATASAGATPVSTSAEDANAARARALLNQMVQALGGQRWLTARNSYVAGRIAAFYQGKPTGDNVQYWQWSTPSVTRVDLNEKNHDKHNWVQIYQNRQCWEITFQGKKAMTPKNCAAYNRLHDHSVEAAVRVWMKDPGTLLLYEGQHMVEAHLADQITLLSDRNDALTLRLDTGTHLPLSCSWSWRDPVYHDKDHETVEFAEYHPIDGILTPFSITTIRNGDIAQQRFVFNAAYNVPLPPDGFSLDAITAHIVH